MGFYTLFTFPATNGTIYSSSLKGTTMGKSSKRKTPNYRTLKQNINKIDKPYRDICHRINEDNRPLFELVQGSTNNHQTWPGGYSDHINDGMNLIRHLYKFFKKFGRRLPFSCSDALLVFFLHDLEKPWRIEIVDGVARNRAGLKTKLQFKKFREKKLLEYGLELTPALQNAFTYIEGEYKDYTPTRRVMNELAAFCHAVDTWCARGWYDYPKAESDEWYGAGRFRTTKK